MMRKKYLLKRGLAILRGIVVALLSLITPYSMVFGYDLSHVNYASNEPIREDASQRNIRGKVTTSDGTAIQGVSITSSKSTIATSTDAEGTFSIAAVAGDILTFKSVGYQDRQMTVAAADFLNVTLETSSETLDQIVVVGFGTQEGQFDRVSRDGEGR